MTAGRITSVALAAVLVVGVACASSPEPVSSSASPTASATPRPSPTAPLSLPQLKLIVLDAVGGHLDYCDPDEFPISHGTPLENAKDRLPTIEADAGAYRAILSHEGIAPGTPLTDDQLIAVNEDYKQIQAIDFAITDEGYYFKVYVPDQGSPTRNHSVTGIVSRFGDVVSPKQGPGKQLQCPICLAVGDSIGTPTGPVPVQDIRVGMVVWTVDRSGARVRAVVLQTGHMAAPLGHEVVRLTLADGRSVVASPGHPTADGRHVGELRPGDVLDGSRVVRVEPLPYGGRFTYDLLPSGPTGAYFANGVLLGSTL